MEAAGVPKRVYRDSGSDSQPSSRWTVAQILTPILIAFFLCLAFILYFLYQRGSLSLLFMRGVRRVRRHREWEVDGGGSDFPHAPDAEATPMISQPHHWNSFFPRNNNTTDRQRLSSRIREGMATPSITTAIRSIRRLFGRGPIPVSRAPMSDTFDLESSDSETDRFDTLRSNASRAKLRPFAKQTVASGSERGASSYTLTHQSDGTRDSQALDGELDDSDQTLDQGVVSGVGGGYGADDHDNTGDCVMLITRNGEDFSSGSTSISLRSRLAEADQSSIEVVPPTPTVPFRVGAYHSRSASTPHLHSPSDSPLLHSFSPSTGDLSSPRIPPSQSRYRSRPNGKDPIRAYHHFTEAAAPTKPVAADTAPPLTLSLHAPPKQRSRGAHSPPLSPHLQNYMPSFPGRSPPGSPYALPNSVPSSPISASDLRNLIPPAVRGAGYNPFQHGRSASDLA